MQKSIDKLNAICSKKHLMAVFYKFFKIIGIYPESSTSKQKHFPPKSFNDAPM